MRKVHAHPLDVPLLRNGLDHLTSDSQHLLSLTRAVARQTAAEQPALVQRERGVLGPQIRRARNVRKGAPDDDVRRGASVRVRCGLDAPQGRPHRICHSERSGFRDRQRG